MLAVVGFRMDRSWVQANLVLVEAAVRNTILQLRGIDTYQEFVDRHRRAMERDSGG